MISSTGKYTSWIPHGFDYYSQERTQHLLDLSDRLRKSFMASGYSEVRLPTFDYARTFRLTSRNPVITEIFETRDSDGDQLGVRSDLTVQVIKGAANGHFGSDFPMRLSYLQPVFHDIPWGSGRRREVLQAGVELIGDPGTDRAQEILDLARTTLESLGLNGRILYGDGRFLEVLFRQLPENIQSDLSNAFHIKDTHRIASICRDSELNQELTDLMVNVPVIFGGDEALRELEILCKNQPELVVLLKEAAKREGVIYDFSLVKELTYYTGPVFEGYIPGNREKILSGGIYDSLYNYFSGMERQSCGFAFNVTTLLNGLSKA